MESSGSKRRPLGPLSPSSAQDDIQTRTNKRNQVLLSGEHSTPHSTITGNKTTSARSLSFKENIQPNVLSTPCSVFGNQTTLLTPSQRRLHNVDLSQVSSCNRVFPSGVTTTDNASSNQTTLLTPSQRRLHNVDISQVSSCNRVFPSGVTTTDNALLSKLTPSERRLMNVDLSNISSHTEMQALSKRNETLQAETYTSRTIQTPYSRLIQSRVSSKNKELQIQGRRITKNQLSSELNLQHTPTNGEDDSYVITPQYRVQYSSSRTTIDSRVVESSENAIATEKENTIHVTVAEPEEMSIKRPVWFQAEDVLNGTNKNLHHEQEKTSAAKNLLQTFNDEGEEMFDIDPEYDQFVSDADDDAAEENVHRGEYLSDSDNENDTDGTDLWKGYMDLGPPSKVCPKCKAIMWNEERNNKSAQHKPATFSLCCKDGQVKLPAERKPPPFLASLLYGGEKSLHFKQNIRTYNSLFQFTSIGGKIDRKINNGGGPYCFKLNGQNYHLIGSLKPKDGQTPKFCQLYVYDTENEIHNRMAAVPGSDALDPEIVEGLMHMLDENNKLAEGFRYARDRLNLPKTDEFSLLLVSSKSASGRKNQVGPSNEVVALIVGDSEDSSPFRDIVVETKQRFLKRVYETCKHFMQLQYPLLFPYGDDGFHVDIPLHSKKNNLTVQDNNDQHPDETNHRTTVTMREYYAYKLMVRPDEGMNLHLGGRLWQQFVVDAFAAVEQYRLDWVRNHQSTIRSELYRSIRDSIWRGDTDPGNVGKNVILPATHTGSQRYMNQYFKDSLAICRTIGHPTLFLTMTCNTQWPEIKRMMDYFPGVDVADKPDVVARVFKLKLDQLLDLIKNKNYFGKCIGVMHVIEFQKRGLPHCHMLIWLHPKSRPQNVGQIDNWISAEIPDPISDPIGHNVVQNFMIHGPCGNDYAYSPCMVKGKCGRHFPKRFNANTFFDDCGFPVYRRRRSDLKIKKKGVFLDNQYVVPYNRDLLIRFHCHINLEVCNSSRSLKYLFKYCLKGHDTATMILRKKQQSGQPSSSTEIPKSTDEIKNFLDGRYICASEDAWRILGFDIHHRFPSVERLPVHLEGEKNVSFKPNQNLKDVAEKAKIRFSKLEGWFNANREFPEARQYTYTEFPQFFTWKADQCGWKFRQRSTSFGRLSDVHASAGECFFLRLILMHCRGATSYAHLKTVNGIKYNTYKEACDALGLLKDDKQWHVAMSENAVHAMPRQLRQLFVHIMSNNQIADPLKLWKNHWNSMSEDILHSRRRETSNMVLQLSESDIQNICLAEIEKLFSDVGKSLRDFPTMPFPDDTITNQLDNRLISEELGYDRFEQRTEHEKLYRNLNEKQLQAYNCVIDSVRSGKDGVFFVYGSGGCGKTYLWNTLCCRLRSLGRIVLPVASSGIAATLLPGGRTAHSRFHIPLKIDQYSVAGIKHGSDLAELIKQTSLIIWDEAPMQHRHAFECVDRSLRDIMSSVDPLRAGLPFGGITVVFGGDFRQTLPVIPKASRAQVVGSSLNSSNIRDHCKVLLLDKNMRLSAGKSPSEIQQISDFSSWVLKVGNGTLPNIHPDDTISDPDVEIPPKFLIRTDDQPIKKIVDKVYPDIVHNFRNPGYLRERSILTPTNAIVSDINAFIIDQLPGKIHTYYSQDSLVDNVGEDNDFGSAFPVEYLNSINMPCLPRHDLKIKEGCVIMLMRNMNQILGLCNGTRMVVKKCLPNSILCEILTGSQVGSTHIIPRIEMEPSDTNWPFEFKRIQFPVQLCFAMTINKSQGQSLNKVGIYLPRSVFTHGQLYVAVSRVTSPSGLHILIDSDRGGTTNVTANVVFEEVFYNLPSDRNR